MKNHGYQNEYDFVELFNNKYLHDLDDNYVWILKHDIYDLILSKRILKYTSPHIGCMTIGPKKRIVNVDSKYWDEKYIVCVRWNYIREDIINFKRCSTMVD